MYDQERKGIAQDLVDSDPLSPAARIPVDAEKLNRLIQRYESRLAQQVEIIERQKQRIIVLEAEKQEFLRRQSPGVTGG